MIQIDMKMPEYCDDCWALDESGDYPMCRITGETRGYNFDARKKRMDKCPMKPVEAVPLDKLCEWLGNLGMLAPGYFDDEPCAGCELAPYWKNKKSDCWKHEIEKWMEGLNGNK